MNDNTDMLKSTGFYFSLEHENDGGQQWQFAICVWLNTTAASLVSCDITQHVQDYYN